MILAYEGGLILLGPRAMRNGADVWLRELLEWLGRELTSNSYDLKHIARLILNSHAYQRAVVPHEEARKRPIEQPRTALRNEEEQRDQAGEQQLVTAVGIGGIDRRLRADCNEIPSGA